MARGSSRSEGVSHQGNGEEARLGAGDLGAGIERAGLVLPASARGERLLQAQHLVEDLAPVQFAAHQPPDDGHDHRPQDARGAQAAALGNPHERGEFDAAAEFLEHLAERNLGRPRGRLGRETRNSQRGFGQREGIARPAEIEQLIEIADLDAASTVDRGHANHGLEDGAAIAMDGRLAVQVDGYVGDVAAVFERVGRRVGPAPAEIHTGRAPAPDGLIGPQGVAGAAGGFGAAREDDLVQLAEGGGLETRTPCGGACALRGRNALGGEPAGVLFRGPEAGQDFGDGLVRAGGAPGHGRGERVQNAAADEPFETAFPALLEVRPGKRQRPGRPRAALLCLLEREGEVRG